MSVTVAAPFAPSRFVPSGQTRRYGARHQRLPRALGHALLLIGFDMLAGIAAPHAATILAGPAPTLAAGSDAAISFGIFTVMAMLLAGLYRTAPARAPLSHAAPILRALIGAYLVILLRFALIRVSPTTPPLAGSIGWAALTFALTVTLVLGGREALALWWGRAAGFATGGHAALVTTGTCDRALATRLDRLAGHQLGYLFTWGSAPAAGLRAIADAASFETMIRAGEIDEIVVFTRRTDDAAARTRIDALLARLADQPVRVRLAFDAVAEIGGADLATGQTLRMVTVLNRPMPPIAAFYKRAIDLVGATILLLFAAPLMAIIALALRPTGPVLFRQPRTGIDGTPFTVLKFRTMRVNHGRVNHGRVNHGRVATLSASLTQAQRGDARITRLGRILRRLSLDELPQLFNVLRGEMSLVGPRPHAPHTTAGDFTFERALEFYGLRHRVKPGLTGLAQVNGLRGPTGNRDILAARVAADLDYIEHWSPGLDLLILLRTIPAVIGGHNAF